MSTLEKWYSEDHGVGASLVTCAVDEEFPSILANRLGHDHELYRFRSGWPMLAMEFTFTQSMPGHVLTFKHALLAPDWVQRPDRFGRVGARPRSPMWERYLPLRPVPLGFAMDSLSYAVAAYLPFAMVGGVRRVVRRKAGRCVRCNYDRRGLAPDAKCPECGTLPLKP